MFDWFLNTPVRIASRSRPYQTSMVELLQKIFNDNKPQLVLHKSSIKDISESCKCVFLGVLQCSFSEYLKKLRCTLHKKRSFPLSICSENVTKSTVSCRFGHIY